MSASSHTRDHRYAPEYAAAVIALLECHGRRVLNPDRALQLEVSKVAQYAALEAQGIRTPRTIAVVGTSGLSEAAAEMGAPFITKHNRAGKGLGVRLFQSVEELEQYVASDSFEVPIDGITLIQQYIAAPEPFITRCEFVGQEFVYAVRVDTSDGFLLCPADECQDEDATVCPATSAAKFEIIEDFDDPIIEDYRRMLVANDIHVAGIENIISADGKRYTYDINTNTNTNYNPRAEHRAGKSGMGEIRVAVDFFAFTANNMTYAAAGYTLGYWQFFPVADGEDFGVIPVWGFANVVESRSDAVAVGERLYGYFPPADSLIMLPERVDDKSLFDGAEHRQSLPPLYNRYQRVRSGGPVQAEQLQALLGPLYNTSFCLWDQIKENDYYGAKQVLLLSASSKTSIGLAKALADDPDAPPVIGLTSSGNVDFVNSLGYYDGAIDYKNLASVVNTPTVIVDMAGNAGTAQALRDHLGDSLAYFISVGLTHWDQADTQLDSGRERHEWFFAPSYILERSKALERGEFVRNAQSFVMGAAAAAGEWLTLQEANGVEDFSKHYPDICAGAMNPAEGLICKL
ncbi:DUF2855 family protein [Congregibacter sp.]|uniref:DUF2855 family protein n=1 Tax=Congregibacter sp. TaxID=2744308 RepID=UPI003F6D8C65